MPTRGRIKFAGNPWPAGHPLKYAKWSATLEPEGLRFQFHLESGDYNAEDDRDNAREPTSDWKARIVWNNYHSCILSSITWGHKGVLAATPGKPLALDRMAGTTLRADPFAGEIPEGTDPYDLAFGIYLLGHDSVANHRIKLVKRRGPWTYDIEWKAKIALSYTGDHELKHSMTATIEKLPLTRIVIGDELETKDARSLVSRVIAGGDKLTLHGRAFAR